MTREDTHKAEDFYLHRPLLLITNFGALLAVSLRYNKREVKDSDEAIL